MLPGGCDNPSVCLQSPAVLNSSNWGPYGNSCFCLCCVCVGGGWRGWWLGTWGNRNSRNTQSTGAQKGTSVLTLPLGTTLMRDWFIMTRNGVYFPKEGVVPRNWWKVNEAFTALLLPKIQWSIIWNFFLFLETKLDHKQRSGVEWRDWELARKLRVDRLRASVSKSQFPHRIRSFSSSGKLRFLPEGSVSSLAIWRPASAYLFIAPLASCQVRWEK